VIVLGYASQTLRSLAELKRRYGKRTGDDVSDGSWYPRFCPELMELLRRMVQRGVQRPAQATTKQLAPKLEAFKDLYRMTKVLTIPSLNPDGALEPPNTGPTPQPTGAN
jgi:hypothetical protein